MSHDPNGLCHCQASETSKGRKGERGEDELYWWTLYIRENCI